MPKIIDWIIWMLVGIIIYSLYFAIIYCIATILLKATENLIVVLLIIAAMNSLITWFTRKFKK